MDRKSLFPLFSNSRVERRREGERERRGNRQRKSIIPLDKRLFIRWEGGGREDCKVIIPRGKYSFLFVIFWENVRRKEKWNRICHPSRRDVYMWNLRGKERREGDHTKKYEIAFWRRSEIQQDFAEFFAINFCLFFPVVFMAGIIM